MAISTIGLYNFPYCTKGRNSSGEDCEGRRINYPPCYQGLAILHETSIVERAGWRWRPNTRDQILDRFHQRCWTFPAMHSAGGELERSAKTKCDQAR